MHVSLVTISHSTLKDSDADTASRKLADLERTYKAQLTEKDALVQDMETRLAQLDATVERLTRDISDGRAVERRHIEQIHAVI